MSGLAQTVNALLGGLLIDGDATLGIAAILPVEDMPPGPARSVYAAMVALAERDEPVDYITVCDELDRHGKLGEVGRGNLVAAINWCPSSLNVEHYAGLIARRARKARMAATLDPKGAIAI